MFVRALAVAAKPAGECGRGSADCAEDVRTADSAGNQTSGPNLSVGVETDIAEWGAGSSGSDAVFRHTSPTFIPERPSLFWAPGPLRSRMSAPGGLGQPKLASAGHDGKCSR